MPNTPLRGPNLEVQVMVDLATELFPTPAQLAAALQGKPKLTTAQALRTLFLEATEDDRTPPALVKKCKAALLFCTHVH